MDILQNNNENETETLLSLGGDYSKTNSKIIYYGITSYLQAKMSDYVSITGEPVIFAEKDEKLDKYRGRKLFGIYDVVSLDEALSLYPDAEMWVVYRNPNVTARRLAEKMDPFKIHFFESDLEYRLGCRFLGHFISYRKDNFSPCCITKQCPVVKTEGSIKERLFHWTEYTSGLMNNIKNNKENPCASCPHLKYGFWHSEVKLDTVSFGTNQPGDVCNYHCVYCFSEKPLERLKDDTDGFTTYEIIKQLSEMPEYDTESFNITLSNGEFCVNKYCDEIFDILLNTKWKVSFVTNSSVYREKFAQFLKTGRTTKVLISLDAGTREIYHKVKGLDMFDKVIENMKRYEYKDVNFILKYIFLEGINDNEADIDGFLDVVKEVGCGRICLSSDLFKPFTPKMRELSIRLIKKAKPLGITISNQSSYLCKKDAEFIAKSFEEM